MIDFSPVVIGLETNVVSTCVPNSTRLTLRIWGNALSPCSPRRLDDLARIAFTQFSELGFEKVSLDRVAEEAGVTKGVLSGYPLGSSVTLA